jgi:hypothetical protein
MEEKPEKFNTKRERHNIAFNVMHVVGGEVVRLVIDTDNGRIREVGEDGRYTDESADDDSDIVPLPVKPHDPTDTGPDHGPDSHFPIAS